MTGTPKKSVTRKLVIVAGMHRSGTSALTRVVNLCGAELPASLLVPVAEENAKGYWESQRIMEFHDEVLASFGMDWASPSTLPKSWFKSAEAAKYSERLQQLLNSELEGFELGVVKDPRICKLLPLWEATLANMQIEMRIIVCVRNPLAIAASLQERNQFSETYSLLLWYVHLRELVHSTANHPRVWVLFDDLFENYTNVVRRIRTQLDIDLNLNNDEIQQEIKNFLNPALCHHTVTSAEFLENDRVPAKVKALYRWLEQQCRDKYDAQELPLVAMTRQGDQPDLSEFGRYLSNLDSLLAQLESSAEQTTAIEAKFKQTKAKLIQLQEKLNKSDARIVELETAQLALNSSLVTAGDKLKQKENLHEEQLRQYKRLSALNERTTKDLETVELRLHDLTQTAAWRLGARVMRWSRCFRESRLGRFALAAKALLSLRFFNYLHVRKKMKIIADAELFDREYYEFTYPLLRHTYKSPLEHYVVDGEREGRQPNRAFKPYFYAQQLAAGDNPWGSELVHYIKQGAKAKLDPNPKFSSEEYCAEHTLGDLNPLAHYLRTTHKQLDSRPNLAPAPRAVRRHDATFNAAELWHVLSDPFAVSRNEKLNELLNEFHLLVSGQPLVSIIIPVFNQLDFTLHCLWSLSRFQHKTAFEVIVVNDCSSDESQEILQLIPGLMLLNADENKGFVESCNLGAKAARGKYALFLNNDTAVLEGWLDSLVSVFESFPNAGLVCSKLLYPDATLQEAGCVVWNDGSAWNLGRNDDPQRPEFNYLRDTHYGSGCSIITPLKLFEDLGSFDLAYRPGYYEDIDYAYKVREQGLRVIYQPGSQLIHFEGQTGGTDVNSGAKQHQITNRETFRKSWSSELALEAKETQAVYRVDNHHTIGNVLFIEPTHLTPDQDAGSAMSLNLILAMLKMRFKVTFVAADSFTHHERYTKMLQAAGVECLYRPYYTSLADVFQARPNAWEYIFIARLHCITDVYDEVVRANPHAKIIYQTIDLSFLRERRELELDASAGNQLTVKHKEQRELEFIEACDKSIIVSGFEKAMLSRRGLGEKVATMPLLAYDFPAPIIGNRHGVMFIGGFRHQPNIDAVKFLADDILPLVVAKHPNTVFYIVGGDAPEELTQRASANLIFMGQISDPDKMFMSMRASIAPLRFGAGIKGKVIQSMAAGLPCAGTTIAVEGIGSAAETGVMVADDPVELAQAIITLIDDDSVWLQAAQKSYEFASRRYTAEAVQQDVEQFFQSL